MFNTSRTGGYGCVGKDITAKGTWMYSDRRCSYELPMYDQNNKRPFGASYSVSFRRQYWYRAKVGLYAPTRECYKRMAEIGHLFE